MELGVVRIFEILGFLRGGLRIHRSSDIVLCFGLRLLEFLEGLPERPEKLREFFGPEEQKDNKEDDYDFLESKGHSLKWIGG
jgi:hypothetical protein